MKKIIMALLVMLMLTACAPRSTPAPTSTITPEPTVTNTPEPTATNTPEPTPTDIPTLDDVYSDLIAKYNELFPKLTISQGEQDKIKPLDFYFFEEGNAQSLVANVGVVASEQNTMNPVAYPIAIISFIIEENVVSYPRDLDTLVINEVDDFSGTKYKVHTAIWSDFMDFSVGKITLEQLFARMEHEEVR